MRKSPNGIEAKFKKQFDGVIWRSIYNKGGFVYLLNQKEYDISFLTWKDIEKLMEQSLEKNVNLILDACKDKEIIHSKKNEEKKVWRVYY